jgi:cytochrome c peroxidase
MKRAVFFPFIFFLFVLFASSFSSRKESSSYISFYKERVIAFREQQINLLTAIIQSDNISGNTAILIQKIKENRLKLKEIDFWLRYFEPIAYKKINGPLPVEWETEVFEKHEAPYKREGAGLTLAELYLAEENANKDSLATLITTSLQAIDVFLTDSIKKNLDTYHHFFLANRMFLLNLSAIYTTGFECPDSSNVIPELLNTLQSIPTLYEKFDKSFPAYKINTDYIHLYNEAITFVKNQPIEYSKFHHFKFIQDFVNPLYQLNHQMILTYNVRTTNYNDYSLNKYATSIFDKSLYKGQNKKGVYIGIDDEKELNELKAIGQLLFYDPILSLNNKRSCASCHIPTQFFTDTTVTTNIQFDQKTPLLRNTPSLLNAVQNHLMMLDGKHTTLENQTREVVTNPIEMASNEEQVLKKILSCEDYKNVFKKYLKATPQYQSINLEHIASALMLYYSDFSSYYSPFDDAMNKKKTVSQDIQNGFNLFMSKAQCATCHFVPQFNGTKPPYISSEFEVIGVPADTSFRTISTDKGRYFINPAKETYAAFRTGSIRNAAFTKPYMHNGVFKTLEEVIDFYDAGGGKGKGLTINNQTLSSDSLKLTKKEKKDIITFIHSLTEEIPKQVAPTRLPVSKNKELNKRVIGGEY